MYLVGIEINVFGDRKRTVDFYIVLKSDNHSAHPLVIFSQLIFNISHVALNLPNYHITNPERVHLFGSTDLLSFALFLYPSQEIKRLPFLCSRLINYWLWFNFSIADQQKSFLCDTLSKQLCSQLVLMQI